MSILRSSGAYNDGSPGLEKVPGGWMRPPPTISLSPFFSFLTVFLIYALFLVLLYGVQLVKCHAAYRDFLDPDALHLHVYLFIRSGFSGEDFFLEVFHCIHQQCGFCIYHVFSLNKVLDKRIYINKHIGTQIKLLPWIDCA